MTLHQLSLCQLYHECSIGTRVLVTFELFYFCTGSTALIARESESLKGECDFLVYFGDFMNIEKKFLGV